MADIVYNYYDGVYLNITNKCPCKCVFCIRSQGNGVGTADDMWFKSEPTLKDIEKAIDEFDFSGYKEAVFCGYGEPTNSFENLIESAKYLKSKYPNLSIRLNTNGLSDLINGSYTAGIICSVFDEVSVSLNEVNSEKYDKITRNIFPGKAFDAMIKFTADCVKEGAKVYMTAVDVISKEDIEKSRKISKKTGAEFRLRSFEKGR